MRKNKYKFISITTLLLVFSLCPISVFADGVSVSVNDDGTLLAKGNFTVIVDLLIIYKVVTLIKRDDVQIFRENVTLGPGVSKVKRTGPDFEFLAKLVNDPEGDKLIVRYKQINVSPDSKLVATVKVLDDEFGELLHYARGILGFIPVTSECNEGDTIACYTGDPGTEGVGACQAGIRTCLSDGTWSSCEGEILPQTEICDETDNDCDGEVDEDGVCGLYDLNGEWNLNTEINYRCAFGVVNFSFNSISITQSGTNLIIATGTTGVGDLTGSFINAQDFSTELTLFGTCNETYRLSGTVTDIDTLEGTFERIFEGSCIDCLNATINIVGTRN